MARRKKTLTELERDQEKAAEKVALIKAKIAYEKAKQKVKR